MNNLIKVEENYKNLLKHTENLIKQNQLELEISLTEVSVLEAIICKTDYIKTFRNDAVMHINQLRIEIADLEDKKEAILSVLNVINTMKEQSN